MILGLGGTGGGYWCGACEYCLRGQPRHCAQTQGRDGHVRRAVRRLRAGSLVKLPDSVGDTGGAARLRRPHRVRRGEEAARSTACCRDDRSRSSARPAASATTPCSSPTAFRLPGRRRRHRRGTARLRALARRRARGRSRRARSRSCSASSAASTPRSCSPPGSPASDLGLQLLRKAGLFVGVGLPPTSEGNFELNPFQLFMKEPTIIYSAVGNRAGHARARRPRCRAARSRRTSPAPARCPSSDAIFDELEAGKFLGRAVDHRPRSLVSIVRRDGS